MLDIRIQIYYILYIYLGRSKTGEEGAKYIADAVRQNKTLVNLNICNLFL